MIKHLTAILLLTLLLAATLAPRAAAGEAGDINPKKGQSGSRLTIAEGYQPL